ncbi:DUF7524 family protein [Halomarina pelagica]|uniref:DUF7524 family protein n=1 Tax=Halomarina pelagica TaxID=2961599 RepID=UPI0020C3B8D6|nr:hypothetical protein [Halomarina sp. BND7]
MSKTLVVDLNEDGLHTVTVPETFSSSGEFDLVLENHGPPTRVHLSLDDALADVVELDASHHYVTEGATERVPVRVAPDADARGRMTVAVSYGATTADVLVDLEPSDPEKPPVEVDESLGTPTPGRDGSASPSMGFGDPSVVPAVALGGVAVFLAVATLTVDGVAAVVLAVLAVLAAVLAAGYAMYHRR